MERVAVVAWSGQQQWDVEGRWMVRAGSMSVWADSMLGWGYILWGEGTQMGSMGPPITMGGLSTLHV